MRLISEMTEGEILEAVLASLGPSNAELGPGDDCAVVALNDSRVVASCDTLVHGPDFRTSWSTGYDLGWKSAAVNLADVAAMAARPVSLLVALTVPGDTELAYVTEIARGLREGCEALAPGCTVDGGDLTISPTLTVAVTAFGSLDGRTPVRRSGAQVGDIVAVAGSMGRSMAGLEILMSRFRDENGNAIPIAMGSLTDEEQALVAAQLRPEPPIAVGALAWEANAMMDVSDGLALDASRLAKASGVAIDFERSRLGDDPARALAGGEDHALLATFPAGVELPKLGECPFVPVGIVRAGTGEVLVDGEALTELAGWDPYRSGEQY